LAPVGISDRPPTDKSRAVRAGASHPRNVREAESSVLRPRAAEERDMSRATGEKTQWLNPDELVDFVRTADVPLKTLSPDEAAEALGRMRDMLGKHPEVPEGILEDIMLGSNRESATSASYGRVSIVDFEYSGAAADHIFAVYIDGRITGCGTYRAEEDRNRISDFIFLILEQKGERNGYEALKLALAQCYKKYTSGGTRLLSITMPRFGRLSGKAWYDARETCAPVFFVRAGFDPRGFIRDTVPARVRVLREGRFSQDSIAALNDDIFGCDLVLELDRKEKTDAALKRVEAMIGALRGSRDQRGNILDLTGLPDDTEIIIVGDLHGRVDNLDAMLHSRRGGEASVLERVRRHRAVLIILGDAPHCHYSPEQDSGLSGEELMRRLCDMDPSLEIMQKIMDLKTEPGDHNYVHYLLGNHDVAKEGCYVDKATKIDQAKLYWAVMRERYGDYYVSRYEEFIKVSPLVLVANGLVAAHAGPTRGLFLSDIRHAGKDNREIIQALWRRHSTYHAKPRGGWRSSLRRILYWPLSLSASRYYCDADVERFLYTLAQPGAIFVVGHIDPLVLAPGTFYDRITKRQYALCAARDTLGYASYQKGKIELVKVEPAIINDVPAREQLRRSPESAI